MQALNRECASNNPAVAIKSQEKAIILDGTGFDEGEKPEARVYWRVVLASGHAPQLIY